MLYSRAVSLNLRRSTLIRFSVPSNCACSSLKFSLAFNSGWFSVTANSRLNAPPTAPCAFGRLQFFQSQVFDVDGHLVAFALADTTASNVFFSCAAYPLTVLTRLGIRSERL